MLARKRLQIEVDRFRQRFGDQPTRALQAVLSPEQLCQLVDEEIGDYRNRVYSPLTTLGLFIGQALSPDGACQDAVARHLSERTARHQRPCSLNTGPYCRARQRIPETFVRRIAEDVGARLEQATSANWKWRGRSIKLMDGTTVSMPDTEKNQSVYPQSGVQKSGLGFPLAMLVGLISLSTGAVLGWALGPCRGKQTGEQALFRHLMPQLQPGDILLADRYHCTYFTVAQLRALGVDLVTRQHQRRITDFQRGKRLGRRDHLIEWLRPKRPPWMTLDTYASMPEKMMLRETEVAGRILVTTFPDPPVRKRGRNRQALRQALAGRGRSPLDQGRDGHGHSSNPDARDGRKGDCRLSVDVQPRLCLDVTRRCRIGSATPIAQLQRNGAASLYLRTTASPMCQPIGKNNDGISLAILGEEVYGVDTTLIVRQAGKWAVLPVWTHETSSADDDEESNTDHTLLVTLLPEYAHRWSPRTLRQAMVRSEWAFHTQGHAAFLAAVLDLDELTTSPF